MDWQKKELYKDVAPLRCTVFENVTLLPMMYSDFDPITNFALGAYMQNTPIAEGHRFIGGQQYSKQLPPLPASQVVDQEVIYGGPFWNHWGHFLIESLQRLWYTQYSSLPIVWLKGNSAHNNEPFFNARHEEVFKLLGINNTHLYLQTPTTFSKVHFPQSGFELGPYGHPQQAEFLGRHKGHVHKGKYVYLSRSRFNGCVNEKALEQLLENIGWEIVFPEELSVAEQVHILTSAEVCLMLAGSAQHTLILTQETHTRFIVIPRVHNITYELVSHFTAKEYYLLHLEQKVHNGGMGSQYNKFSLNLQELSHLIKKTNNFTCDLSYFAPLIQRQEAVSTDVFNVPEHYATAETRVFEAEEYYYTALFHAHEGRIHKAYELFMHMYTHTLLEFYMYDYFFEVVEKYDALTGNITKLALNKKQFLLDKATKNLTQNPEHGDNYIRLGQVLQDMQRFDAAVHIMQRAIQKFPQWALPQAGLANVYLAKGELKMALHHAKEALNLEPHDIKIKQVFAHCMYLLGKK